MPNHEQPAQSTIHPQPEAAEHDAAAAHQEFLSQAHKVVEPQPYRLDPDLAITNIKVAMKVIADHRDAIPQHLPHIDLHALASLPRLALATKYSAMEAEKTVPSERLVSQKVAEARQVRGTLLSVVGGLAATGLVPQSRVDDIVRGRGPRDTAEDCVALAQLFRDGGAALAGKHSVDPEMIEKAATVGSWLLQHLRPTNARAQKAPPPPPAVELRNRFATLLAQRYAKLQAVAHYFYGDAWEDVTPPLMARQAARPKKDAPSADAGAGSGASVSVPMNGAPA